MSQSPPTGHRKEDTCQYWLNCDFLVGGEENGCETGSVSEKVLLIWGVSKEISACLSSPLPLLGLEDAPGDS